MRGNIESRDRVELKPQLRDRGLRLSDDDQQGRPTAGHTLHTTRPGPWRAARLVEPDLRAAVVIDNERVEDTRPQPASEGRSLATSLCARRNALVERSLSRH